MARPGWNDSYWKKLDKESARRLRTTCPKCGSDKTYYNKQFKVWRCGRCENSWVIQGIKSGESWWKRLWRRIGPKYD